MDFGWASSPPVQVVQEVPDEDLPELDISDCCRCLMTFSHRVQVDEGYEMSLRQCWPFSLSEVMKKRSKMCGSASRLVMCGRIFFYMINLCKKSFRDFCFASQSYSGSG